MLGWRTASDAAFWLRVYARAAPTDPRCAAIRDAIEWEARAAGVTDGEIASIYAAAGVRDAKPVETVQEVLDWLNARQAVPAWKRTHELINAALRVMRGEVALIDP